MGRKKKDNYDVSFFRWEPKTENHRELINYLRNPDESQSLLLLGCAGTGKTVYIIQELLYKLWISKTNKEKIVIIRSAVPSRDIGFSPGRVEEKIRHYELPYTQKINKIFNSENGYDLVKSKELLEFDSTSFLRGTEWNNCYVYVDEIQNMNFQELETIITRMGDNCQLLFSGDEEQSDLKHNSSISKFLKIIKSMQHFKFIEFTEKDIVRSGLIMEYLTQKKSLLLTK